MRDETPTIKSRPLTYIHRIPILRTKRFWDGLREGKLYATRCRSCGKLYYPPQADCPACLSSDMEWVELPREGVLETFVASRLKPQGFEHFPEPYMIAIARIEGMGVRVMGLLKGVEPERTMVGMRVRIKPMIGEDGYHTIVMEPVG